MYCNLAAFPNRVGNWRSSSICSNNMNLFIGLAVGHNDVFDCDFQINQCGFSTSTTSASLRWQRLRGRTKTAATGPTADHTTGSTSRC